jgi:hypothetical protein
VRTEAELFAEWRRVSRRAHDHAPEGVGKDFARGAEEALAWALRLGQARPGGERQAPSGTVKAMDSMRGPMAVRSR